MDTARNGTGGNAVRPADDGDHDEDEESFSSSDEHEHEEEEDDDVLFEVMLQKDGAARPVRLLCSAGLDNRLYVEQLLGEDTPPINFPSLNEQVQDRVYDFLDGLSVDDRFGFFMRRQHYKARRHAAKSSLSALLENVAIDEVGTKPGKKAKKANKAGKGKWIDAD